MLRKPELPDPGDGRYWEIVCDGYGDFYLSLMRGNGVTIMRGDPVPPESAEAERFETEAITMLDTANKRDVFVGTYNVT